MEVIVFLLLCALGLIFYFLPSLVAKKKPHANGVFLVNLLFGWSGLGWIICLIWAYTGEERR